ncbi:MAG: TRAP transporter substrate-binding protein DctP [Rhodospirillales bacterium]|nr:TRAP transporter substrate-binding protein DctP [Rhodospirillales bacterium]
MKKVLAVTALAVGASAMFGATQAQAAERWTCNVFTGPKHYVNKGLKPWGKEVGKVTNGEVKINFLPANAAPPPKQLNGIVAGTFDCAFIFHAFTAKQAAGPAFGILPFLNSGGAELGGAAYWRSWKGNFEDKKEFDKLGIKILSMFQFSPVHFFTATDTPINSIADMKSQKMWALAGTSSKTMKVAGVSHVSGPAARLGEFTQTKVVQGLAGITRGGIVNFAGEQFAKHGTFTANSIMMPSFAWMVSKKKWESLNGGQKKAIAAISGEKLARSIGRASDAFEEVAKVRLAKVGMKEHKATAAFEAELEKAGKPQYDAWFKRVKALGVDGPKVIEQYQSIVRAGS